MDKYKDVFSVCTSFNKRIFEDKCSKLFWDMKDNYSSLDFHVYHENKFEKENKISSGISWDDSLCWNNLTLHDLFEDNNWLHDFLKNSPFKECHKYGTPATFDPPHYWIRNSIYWFRKVVSVYNCATQAKNGLLIYLDADTKFTQPITDEMIDWFNQWDICHINRDLYNHVSSETGFVVYNLKNQITMDFIHEYIGSFVNTGKAFEYHDWSDNAILDLVRKRFGNKLRCGALNGKDFGKAFTDVSVKPPFHVYDYLWHAKEPLMYVRDINPGM